MHFKKRGVRISRFYPRSLFPLFSRGHHQIGCQISLKTLPKKSKNTKKSPMRKSWKTPKKHNFSSENMQNKKLGLFPSRNLDYIFFFPIYTKSQTLWLIIITWYYTSLQVFKITFSLLTTFLSLWLKKGTLSIVQLMHTSTTIHHTKWF